MTGFRGPRSERPGFTYAGRMHRLATRKAIAASRQPLPAALRAVDKTLIGDGCWLFTGSVHRSGYGYIRTGSRLTGDMTMALAHRVVYEALVGPIPAGLELDHLCRTRACINPDHLEPVTAEENDRRRRSDHCRRGHPYDTEWSDGTKVCRKCIEMRPSLRLEHVEGVPACD